MNEIDTWAHLINQQAKVVEFKMVPCLKKNEHMYSQYFSWYVPSNEFSFGDGSNQSSTAHSSRLLVFHAMYLQCFINDLSLHCFINVVASSCTIKLLNTNTYVHTYVCIYVHTSRWVVVILEATRSSTYMHLQAYMTTTLSYLHGWEV